MKKTILFLSVFILIFSFSTVAFASSSAITGIPHDLGGGYWEVTGVGFWFPPNTPAQKELFEAAEAAGRTVAVTYCMTLNGNIISAIV